MLKAKPTSPAAKYHYKKERKSTEYLPQIGLTAGAEGIADRLWIWEVFRNFIILESYQKPQFYPEPSEVPLI
jgi:hypothetical protein